jgi:hypothetical protein
LPWPSLLGFLRIATNPRVFERPATVGQAWSQVAAWLDCEVAWIPQPTDRHRSILESLLAGPGVQANLIQDAHLAALSIEHGLVLCSTDSDFAPFPICGGRIRCRPEIRGSSAGQRRLARNSGA